MIEILKLIGAATVGGIATYVTSRLLYEKQKPTRRVKVSQISFEGVPPDQDHLIDRITHDVPKKLLKECLTVVYHIVSLGNEVIRDLNISCHTAGKAQLASYQYWVDQDLVCERLTTSEEPPKGLRSTWAYINPEDVITLEVLVVGTNDPEDVDLEIDAEGVKFIRQKPQHKCMLEQVLDGSQ